MKVQKLVARTTLYVNGKRTPAENKQGFTHKKSEPKDENDPVFVKKGETYYRWKFARQDFRYSKTYPDRRQLTQNEFRLRLYDLEDQQSGLEACDDFDTLLSDKEALIEEIRGYAEELEERKNNMPDNLQESPSAEILQERIGGLNEWADELENVDIDDVEDGKDSIASISHSL